MSENKRKFRSKITLGVLEDLDMNIDEMSDIANLRKMKLPMLRLFINAMMIEGEPITRDSDPSELETILPELSSFLLSSQQKELVKEKEIQKDIQLH